MALKVALLATLGLAWEASLEHYGAREGVEGLEATTKAFRQALAEIAAAGGGTLFIPPGTWHLQPVNLTSHLVLWLSENATLVADTDMEQLPVLPALPSWGPPLGVDAVKGYLKASADLRDALPRYQPLLWGDKVRNVSITGENGTIDGRGEDWWRRWLKGPLLGRPHAIQFQESQDILIRNVTIRNPGFWTVHLWRCEFVTVQFLSILIDPWAPSVRPTNTDGVNPDSTKHLLLEDSYLQTGDDAVAVKSGWDCFGRENAMASENITIRRVTVRQTRGCNAAAFTVGSEMSGGVQDVTIEDCHVINAGVAVEVKVGATRGGYVRRVAVKNLEVKATARGALVVMASYPESNPFCHDGAQPAPLVSDISFENVHVSGPTQGPLVNFRGTEEVFMQNLSVRGLVGGNQGAWTCNDRISGKAEDCRPSPCWKLRGGRREPRSPRFERLLLRPSPRPRSRPAYVREQLRETSWRDDGRCGVAFPGSNGLPSRCPTADEFEEAKEREEAEPFLRNAPCCSLTGWCGSGLEHCECAGCVDYRKIRELKLGRRDPGYLRPVAQVVQQPQPPLKQEAETVSRWEGSFAMICSLSCFTCILLVRRYVPGASKHWLCRTPHICVGTLVLVTFLQCSMSVWRYSQPPVQPLRPPEALAPAVAPAAPDCGEALTPMDFGARGDGRSDDSEAVRAAIEHGIRCNLSVIIGPPRKSFLVMPNTLQVTAEDLSIFFEGSLVGPSLEAWNPSLETWPKGSCAYAEADCRRGGPSPEFARSQWALLLFRNSRNVTLQGVPGGYPGAGLRAHGHSFWRVRNSRPQVRGYCLLKLDDCEEMRIYDLNLHDSPMYQVVVARSRSVLLSGLQITLSNQALGDAGAHNTDGVNILNSSGITLLQSVIESGDDNVVVKEGSSKIYGEGLQLRRGKGLSIGSLGERDSEGQEVSDVVFRNVSLLRSVHGVRIKTWKGARGLVRNATFEHFRVIDVMLGVLIDQSYCPPSQRPEGCDGEASSAIRIEQVQFKHFTGTFQQADRKVLCSACWAVTYDLDLRPGRPLR